MLKPRSRGLALIHTLALIALVLLVAFAIATSTLSQLNLSARYAQRTQADCTARAAMAEFILRAEQAPVTDITALPPPVLDLFHGHETLLTPKPPLDGLVTLLTNRCVDNSANTEPVASYFDSGGRTSVPPFCVSVVYEVLLGSRKYLYESLLQQRWPYAMTTPGPLFVVGRVGPDSTTTSGGSTGGGAPNSPGDPAAPPSTGYGIDTGQSRGSKEGGMGGWSLPGSLPPAFWCAPSTIKGRVLAMQSNVGLEYDPPDETAAGTLVNPVPVSADTYKALYPYANGGGVAAGPLQLGQIPPVVLDLKDRVTVGGPLKIPSLSVDVGFKRSLYTVTPYNLYTKGARVDGPIDLMENQARVSLVAPLPASVKVFDGNIHTGAVRQNRMLGGLKSSGVPARDRMRALFTKPDTQTWDHISIDQTPLDKIVITSQPGVTGDDTYIVPSGHCQILSDLPGDSFSPKKTPVKFDLQKNTTVVFAGDHNAQGALVLQDVALAVNGDVNLENYLLQGSNATLIVSGTLRVDGGYLDAGQNGMVIYCRRLIMRAQGQINGLIVAEKGAALYGGISTTTPVTDPTLVIKGGLLIGGNDLKINVGGGALLPAGAPAFDNTLLPLEFKTLMMVSTSLEYAPKYLRGLNRFGPHEILATELRQ